MDRDGPRGRPGWVDGWCERSSRQSGPLLVTVVGTVLVAVLLLFPHTLAATGAWVLLAALGGVAVARVRKPVSRVLAPRSVRLRAALAVGTVVVAAAAVFWPFRDQMVFGLGDWAIHRLLVQRLVESLDRGDGIPTWLHEFSTGEPPYELYPVLLHLGSAELIRLFDLRDELPSVVGWSGIVLHVLVSVGATRLAARVAPWPLAALAGLVVLLDVGDLFAGGAVATLRYALLDQTLALACGLFGAVAVLDQLQRPGWPRLVRIWTWFALAALAHPTGVLLAAAIAAGLLVTAATARDVRADRLLYAVLLVGIGVMLTAWVWAPYAERILTWGASYPNPGVDPASALDELVREARLPRSSFPALAGAAFVGLAAAIASRRAAPTLIAATAALLLLGYTDLPFMVGGLAPSPVTARFASFRMVALAKPLLFVGIAYVVYAVAAGLRGRLAALRGPPRGVAAPALAGVVVLLALRAVTPFVTDVVWPVRDLLDDEVPDDEGFEELVAWATERTRQSSPDEFQRVLFLGNEHFVHDVTRRSGLPVFYDTGIPLAYLRERMTDRSPRSLKRFGVRWILRRGAVPAMANLEAELGSYRVAEVPDWDGRFARVDRGAGEAVVTELEDERVVVELRGTDEPALVSLAIGYYPRWRVRHDGRELATYGLATSDDGGHVLSSWLPPGRSVFTADAPMSSDARGRLPSALALLVAIGLVVATVVPRARDRADALIARVRNGLDGRRRGLWRGGLVAAAVALLFLGATGDREVGAVTLMRGFGADAEVEARLEEGREISEWERCDPRPLAGFVDCGEAGWVVGTMSGIVKPDPFSWPLAVPSVVVKPRKPSRWRVALSRVLSGEHEAASFGDRATVTLRVDGGEPLRLGRAPKTVDLGPEAREHRLLLEFDLDKAKQAGAQLVRPDRIDPPPPVPAPPAQASPEVRGVVSR